MMKRSSYRVNVFAYFSCCCCLAAGSRELCLPEGSVSFLGFDNVSTQVHAGHHHGLLFVVVHVHQLTHQSQIDVLHSLFSCYGLRLHKSTMSMDAGTLLDFDFWML